MSDTLYILDGHAQIHRAYHAPFRDLTSPAGEPTRATYVFCSMLLKFLQAKKPAYLAMAIDGPRHELKRSQWYPDYKANRPPLPDDFRPQQERIVEIVKALGIPILYVPGYEADDVLATVAKRFANAAMNVVLISRDKDLDQLVTENVVLYDPMKDEAFNPAAIEAKKGYPPSKAIDVQTLMGDTADNIPGIEGIGPKTAAKLVMKYGSAEAVLAAAHEQTPKLKERLLAGAAAIELSRKLVTLDTDVPIEVTLEAMNASALHYDAIEPLFKELGFSRLLGSLHDLGLPPSEGGDDETPATQTLTSAADFDYHLIDTPEKLDALAKKLAKVKRIAIDTETTSVRAMACDLVGISLAWQPGVAYYLPILGPQQTLFQTTILDPEHVRRVVAPLLADVTITKVGQHFKYDRIVLEQAGYTVNGPIFDTMLAAYVLDATRPSFGMDALAMDFLSHRCIAFHEVCGTGKKRITFDKVPLEKAAPYAAEDADVTLRLADALEPQLVEAGLDRLFRDLETPLADVLAEMEQAGIDIDTARLRALETDFTQQADTLREQIIQHAGHPLNVDSPKQLQVVLFEEQSLPIIKKTKTGASTDSYVLEQLATETDNPIPPLLLDYRKLTKLISTYLVSLRECVNAKTGRVHTSFHQTAVETGRLSSSDPNLQNIPIRTERGRQIRSAFIAAPGHVLLAADYSQVELRMLAHFCRDETLMQAFHDGQDIHRIVAAEVFSVPLADVTKEQRSRAKSVNFGIIYGQTGFGLARSLRISRSDANEFITKYKARFPKIEHFLAICIEQAKDQGYVETIFGRRRKILGIDARNPQQRAAAERLAINSVVQGSAADLIKQAMLGVDKRLRESARPADERAKMLLQIHDELVFEIPEDHVEPQQAMIVEEMTHAIELTVPLTVDVGIGKNWLDAK